MEINKVYDFVKHKVSDVKVVDSVIKFPALLNERNVTFEVYIEPGNFQVVAKPLFTMIKMENDSVDLEEIMNILSHLIEALNTGAIEVYKCTLAWHKSYTFRILPILEDNADIFSQYTEAGTAILNMMSHKEKVGALKTSK